MHRRVKVAIESEDVQLFVVLVLVDRLVGDLDDGVHDLRHLIAHRQAKKVGHRNSLQSAARGWPSTLLPCHGRLPPADYNPHSTHRSANTHEGPRSRDVEDYR